MTVPASPWQRLDRPPLRAASLRRALTGGEMPAWRDLEVVAETGSTNADLAERARAGEPGGLVLAADVQAAGRGRRDRAWTAPPRSSVAVSVLLRPSAPMARWGWLSLLAGVAVTDALVHVCGVPAVLKWPNDVLVPPAPGTVPPDIPAVDVPAVDVPAVDPEGRLKVAGILAEVAGGGVVLGIGLNVSQEATELPVPTATSLALAGSATTDRETVLRAVLRALADRYRAWDGAGGDPRGSGIAAVYRERCVTIGRSVRVHLPDPAGARTVEGVAEGVDDDGRLLVRDGADELHEFAAGDVVHVRPAGRA